MKKYIVLLLIVFALGLSAQDAPRGWFQCLGQPYDAGGIAVATDSLDNVWIAAEVCPGDNRTDLLVQIMDADSKVIGSAQGGGPDYDRVAGMVSDGRNGVYLAGRVRDGFQIDSLTVNGSSFVTRLGSDGKARWILSNDTRTGTGFFINTIASDRDGNCYVAAFFSEQIKLGKASFTSKGDDDVYLCKLDPVGKTIWETTLGGPERDNVDAITIDKDGNCYVAGSFNGTVKFFGTTAKTCSDEGDEYDCGDVFLAKYDANGKGLWVKHFSSSAHDWAAGLTTDPQGNVILASTTEGTFKVDNLSFDSEDMKQNVLTKLDPQGNCLWAKMYHIDIVQALQAAKDGSLYLAGWFYNERTIDNKTVYSHGSEDALIVKLDSEGKLVWLQSGGSEYTDTASGIALDSKGNCLVTGRFDKEMTMYGTTLTTAVSHPEYGYHLDDMFILKLPADYKGE